MIPKAPAAQKTKLPLVPATVVSKAPMLGGVGLLLAASWLAS
jgi:hypothetical protein